MYTCIYIHTYTCTHRGKGREIQRRKSVPYGQIPLYHHSGDMKVNTWHSNAKRRSDKNTRIQLLEGQTKLKCVHVIENATLHLFYSLDHTELRQRPVELTSLGFKHHRLQGSAEYLVTDGHAQNRIHQHGCSRDAWTAQSCQSGSRACPYLSLASLWLSGQSLAWAIPANLILEQKLGCWLCKMKKRVRPLKLKLVSWAIKCLVFLPKASLYFPVRSLTG